MRINRGLLGWGLFFMILGAVALAVRQGVIAEETAGRAWTLWPLLLVAWGLGLILRRTPVEPAADLATSVLFGLIVGGVLSSGSVPFASCGGGAPARPFETRSGTLTGAATVELDVDCGDLAVTTMAGSGWTVAGSAADGRAPDVDLDSGNLEVNSSGGGFQPLRPRESWTVELPVDPALDVDASINAGQARLVLDGAMLRQLSVQVNAGQLDLDLTGVAGLDELQVQLNAVATPRIVLPARSLRGSIDGNAASGIRLCAPPAVGLRLLNEGSVASSDNFAARGLVRVDGGWESPGYADAASRIELRVQVNAGSFDLEPEGACDG